MRVRDLKKLLVEMSDDAFIVINDEIVSDVHLENGRESQKRTKHWISLGKN